MLRHCSRITRKYFDEVEFTNGVKGLICKDGLLLVLKQADIQYELDHLDKDKEGWFWNKSHDRYCAEPWDEYIEPAVSVNPSWLIKTIGWEYKS